MGQPLRPPQSGHSSGGIPWVLPLVPHLPPLFVSGFTGRVKSRPVSAFVGVNGEDRVGSAQVLMDDECVRRVYGVLYPVPETQVPAAGVFPAVSYTEVPAPSATWERSFNDKSGTILEGLKLPLSV